MSIGRRGALPLIAALLAAPGLAAAQSPAAREVTFARDVAPIFQQRCQECHRPGAMAPMSLVNYEDVRPWARAIKTRVVNREMPPFHVDRTIGIQQFKNDPSLTTQEIDTIVRWIDSGAPRGNPANLPPAREFGDPNAWQIGTPDLVVKFPKFLVPAESPDLYGDLFADIPVAEDRYIKAIQTRSATADSHKVVHHALSYTVPPDAIEGDMSTVGGQFLVEYASGKNAEVYPDGSGVLLKAGEKARVSYHTHSYGENTNMEIELGMVLYPKGYVPKKIRWSKQLAQPTTPLDIPPNTVARSDGYVYLHKPARIIAFQPHLHLLGVKQCLELIYPTEGASAKTRWSTASTSTTAGTSPTTTPTTSSRLCRRGRCCTTSSGTTTRPPTRGRPIRATGSATGTARSTRWASSGSDGSSSPRRSTARRSPNEKHGSRRKPRNSNSEGVM